jgi:hypothetical protein
MFFDEVLEKFEKEMENLKPHTFYTTNTNFYISEFGTKEICNEVSFTTSLRYNTPQQFIQKNVEQGVYLTQGHSVGLKFNNTKAPLDIVINTQFPKALQLLALATEYGHVKYNKNGADDDYLNYKRVSNGLQSYFDAAARHNTERNEIDQESGLPHIIHSVWNMLAALELYAEKNLDIKEFSKKYLQDLKK